MKHGEKKKKGRREEGRGGFRSDPLGWCWPREARGAPAN